MSFSGAEREFVRAIAEAVERHLGASNVFFDEWFEFYIGGHDADVKLQRIYGTGCELAVVCVSATYGSKVWTRAEHEAIRSRLMQARAEDDPRQRDRVFPIRVGDGNVDGIPFNAIIPDVRGRAAEQIAELILARLQFVMAAAGPAPLGMPSDHYPGAADGGGAPSVVGAAGTSSAGQPMARNVAIPTPAYLNAEVQALSEQLERARQRQQNLRNAGVGAHEVDREILELRRKLRDGGQLRAGDAVGDDRYLLVKQVGRGGFAVVWEAFDRAEQRRVAIKVLHQHLAADPQRRERFFRGARVMMDLKHPAVVRVLDPRGEDESFCYFVMELVPGGNLREAVLGNRVEAVRRLPLILQVGEALAEAHRKQLVHRDIKPANILLDEHDKAKLTDFDLVGAHDTTGGTRTGALGTIVYAAPECLDKPQDATARADVFGLGMTAIFCLAGRDLSIDTLVDRAGTLAELECTESIRKVLERAVEWKPDRRFADAAEMMRAFGEALGSSAPTANAAVNESIEQTANAGAEPQVDVEVLGVHAGVEALEFQTDVEERPTWAVDSGHDRYGRWAAFEVSGVQQRMRWIPAGRFLMGSPPTEAGRREDEGPQHWVTITKGYWLGETAVTQDLWRAVMANNLSQFVSDDRPAEQVSWDDCQTFIDRLNRQVDGLETRLPTEAEWERACRAQTTTATWVGDLTLRGKNDALELDAIAWYGGNSGLYFELDGGHDSRDWPEKQHAHTRAGTHPVGRKAPNPYGLHDMLGNVFEWCHDAPVERALPAYVSEPVTDPVSDGQGWLRVYRGGSWRSEAALVRAAYRGASHRGNRLTDLGFRLAGDQSVPRNSGTPSIEKPAGRRISVADRPTGDASSLSLDAVLSKIQSAYMADLKRCYREYLMKDANPRPRPPDERFSPAVATLTVGGPPAAFGNLPPLDPSTPGPHTAESQKAS